MAADRFLVLSCQPTLEDYDYTARKPPNWPPSFAGAWLSSVAEITCPARIGVCASAMAMNVEGGAAEVALASTEIIRSSTHLVKLLNARLKIASKVRAPRGVDTPPGPPAAPPGRMSTEEEETEAGGDVRAARSAASHIAPLKIWQLSIVKADAGTVRANFNARLTNNLAKMFGGVEEISAGRVYRLTVRVGVVCVLAPGLVRDTMAMAVDGRAGLPLLRTFHYPRSMGAKGDDELLFSFGTDVRFVAVEGGGGHDVFRFCFRNELHQPLHFTPRTLPVIVTLRLRPVHQHSI